MKTRILIAVSVFALLHIFIYVNNAYALCDQDNDWPEKPCNDVIEPQNPKPMYGDKEDWKVYYSMKGKDWMETKKAEMYYAHEHHILKEWYEYGRKSNNYANFNVWYYYNLYEQSPDILQYYHENVQKDWLKPIVTYYYVSPIIFVMIGIASVAVGFFVSKKTLWKKRK